VKRAIREARALGIMVVDELRVSTFRNDTNVISIVCRVWMARLDRGRGGQIRTPTKIKGLRGKAQMIGIVVRATEEGSRLCRRSSDREGGRRW
jgi:hypothetical protein